MKLPNEHTFKVGLRRTDCALISYSMTNKAYKFLNLEILVLHTIIESINAEFFEKTFLFKKNVKIVGVNEHITRKRDKPTENV